ncbi:growth hormone secretagogue receptor type 1-like [Plakobranchus ocellatus]|uniref:Growth hormone secretagogue receptor type 1-like n=1 Tax=Plakobranchus ocellatus TaxID=259542 RepID=A0AAV4CZ95_9GAST|nr:growth hormone secretagogue receptor type 1-like [Plakobranchus ocellatus]
MENTSHQTSPESSTTTPNLAQLSSEERLLQDINKSLKIYYSMFLIVTGSVLNILSILTLSRKTFRRSTTSVYLRFLAAIDLFVLYNGLGRHFISGAFNYNVRHISEAFCKFNQWTTASGPDISAWILVAVTAERVLSIVRPHSVRILCTKCTARLAALSIIVALLVANLPLLLFYGDFQEHDNITNRTRTLKCRVVRSAKFMDQVWYWLDLAKFVLLPSALLTTFNIVIVSAIARSRRNVRRVPSYRNSPSPSPDAQVAGRDSVSSRRSDGLSKSDAGSKCGRKNLDSIHTSDSRINVATVGEDPTIKTSLGSGLNGVGKTPSKVPTLKSSGVEGRGRVAGGSKETSLTITLVVVSATFVVCNTPVMVFLLNRDGWFRPDQGAASSLTWTVVVMIMYTNNALNFLLYCATGSKFRAEMCAMFASCRSLMLPTKRNAGVLTGLREIHVSSDCSDTPTATTSVSTVQGLAMSVRSSPRPLH